MGAYGVSVGECEWGRGKEGVEWGGGPCSAAHRRPPRKAPHPRILSATEELGAGESESSEGGGGGGGKGGRGG